MIKTDKSSRQNSTYQDKNDEHAKVTATITDLEQNIGAFQAFQKKPRTPREKELLIRKQAAENKQDIWIKKSAVKEVQNLGPDLKKVKKVELIKERADESDTLKKSKPQTPRKEGSKKATPKKETKRKSSKSKKTKNDKLTSSNGEIDEDFSFEDNVGEDSKKPFIIPSWFQKENIKDKQGKRPDEEDYDPTTIYVPLDELRKMKSIWREYWEVKSNHFDKLVVTKRWQFNHFLYDDALIVHKEFNLKLCNWLATPIVTVRDGSLAQYIPKLLALGYKIALMEELGMSVQGDESTIERGLCQIHTRGTSIEGQGLDYSSRFLISIYQESSNFGITLCDTTTQDFYIGQFKDDLTRSQLRTILTRTKPVEVVYIANYLENDTISILKSLSSRPSFSPISIDKPYHLTDIVGKLKLYFQDKESLVPSLPDLLQSISASVEEGINLCNENASTETKLYQYERGLPLFFTLQALQACVEYLDHILLADTIIPIGRFHSLDSAVDTKGSLYLDSQALETLEIFDVNYLASTSEQYSLFGYVNRTISPFGKRMLERWITAPLLNTAKIQARQEAVQDLLNNMKVVEYLQEGLKKLPDLERMIGRIYSYISRKRVISMTFEESMQLRLKNFLNFLGELRKVERLMEGFSDSTHKFKSKRLIELTSFNDTNISITKGTYNSCEFLDSIRGAFPRINHIIKELLDMVEVKGEDVIPVTGINAEIDLVVEKINKIKTDLEEYLEKQRKKLQNTKEINYVNTKLRYELEVPEALVEGSKRPKEYTLLSKRKGFLRFHTPTIEISIPKLVQHEQEFKKLFIPFACEYFGKFYQKHTTWQQLISCLAELDCLCSLASLASSMSHQVYTKRPPNY